MKIDFFDGYTVTDVGLGSSTVHVLCICKTTGFSKVFAWGANNCGQLLQDDITLSFHVPQDITDKFSSPQTQVAAGGFHTLMLSSTGEAVGMGRSNQGQLGCQKAERVKLPL